MSIPWAPLPIPQRQPAQVHLSHGLDQWLGDSKRAPKRAGRNGKTDTNLQPLADGAGAIHAAAPRASGFHFLAIGGGRRRALTKAELDRPFAEWKRADFVRLRRTRRAGFSFESRVRPLLYTESLDWHAKYGAVMCAETKGKFSPLQARGMVEAAARKRVTVWFKTLAHQGLKPPEPGYSMAAAGERLRPFHAAGGQTALAAHNFPEPVDLDAWADMFDVIWGRWA